MIVEVKGNTWDVESVDGNTVTLADGQQIEVSDETLSQIQSQMKKPVFRRRARKTQ